ncbi:hypothetical protein HNO88_001924 [Novosphingobium chloroacetimidivorans]|uniref:Uncharacterized protein n=1 Tax=Novosphingobium chloroacetimidivorans TaxID=1428314 RepID=A0A7W7KAH1_9SPHN|nr:hypothetical protein [Novosphingobium chloroacetimidivorans]
MIVPVVPEEGLQTKSARSSMRKGYRESFRSERARASSGEWLHIDAPSAWIIRARR